MTRLRNTSRIPEMQWSAAYVEKLEDEQAPQRTGCVTCLRGGVDSDPSVIYMISGTSVCPTHAKEQLNVVR